MSTIGCQGTEAALESMLKSLGFVSQGWTGAKHKRWKTGTRYAEGWTYERDNEKSCIAPILVLWQAKAQDKEVSSIEPEQMEVDRSNTDNVQKEQAHKKPKLDSRLFVRIHPSAFHQFWSELLKVAKMQKPQVLVEDLRFEIGSIEIQGPGSTEALVGVLKPANGQLHMEKIWPTLSSLSNPSSLPQNAILALSTIDPRLNHPPRQISVAKDDASLNKLNEMIATWPIEKDLSTSKLFDYKERYRISKVLPTQKAINRRRTALLPGQHLEPTEKDPRMPVILLAHQSPNKNANNQGSWTVLLPWSCVDLVWRSLMYYPLTSGSTPRFGGLEQTHQVAFEQAIPWYPGDCPGTEAGKAWDRTESEERFDEWVRRPPSKRVAWDTLDLGLGRKGELGRGWACDWDYLFRQTSFNKKLKGAKGQLPSPQNTSESEPPLLTQRQRKAATAKAEAKTNEHDEQEARRRNTSSPDSEGEGVYDTLLDDVKYAQLAPNAAAALFSSFKRTVLPDMPALATIRIKYLTRGTPKPAARIYRLPLQTCSITNEALDGKKAIGRQEAAHLTPPSVQQPSESFAPALLSEPTSKSAQANVKISTLRTRWLSFDPNPASEAPNLSSSTALPRPLSKQKYNHSDLPVAPRVYDPTTTRDLSHIRVFPPRETKAEVLNMFGPKPPPRTQSELEKLYVPQLVPKMVVNASGEMVEEGLWDKHIPCPGPEDLIGFVTSGGYNLAVGGGTAIGGVWAQRVVAGWRQEEEKRSQDLEKRTERAAAGEKKTKQEIEKERQQAKEAKQRQNRIERERHLCIVRNAGESVGRLAIWEVC